MNSLCIIGNLTRDVEVKHNQSGKSIAKFGFAVQDGWGDKEHTSFFNVVAFGKQGEMAAQYLSKGKKVGIEGSIRQNSWTTESGEKRSSVDIVANRIEFLSPKQESGASAEVSEDDISW